ncbi:MAG: site-specific integrase [Candidatus Nitrosopolaris sp.]
MKSVAAPRIFNNISNIKRSETAITSVLNESSMVASYLTNVALVNESTAKKYRERLKKFEVFISEHYDLGIDDIIIQITKSKTEVYDLLATYVLYLNNNFISPVTLKNHIITIKNFLEYRDIEISPRKFKLKVRMPRVVRKNKEALSKQDIVDILNECSDIRLKTFVMFLAAGGFRAVEALSVRVKDLDVESVPPRVFIRGEYTKTRTDKIVFLTDEMNQQIKSWISYKYRRRRVCYNVDEKINQNNTKTITEYRTPDKAENDLIFAVYQNMKMPNPAVIYDDLARSFAKTLDRMGKGEREDGNERRRQITLHSFRRFVKTTISDLGYADFSEYFIGHSGSTYSRKKDSEKAEIFIKIEPYLTFLNVHQLERQGADIQSKVEQLEQLNESMRDRDKMKDDAIAHLSDQLIALTTRLDSIERRQQ